MYEVLERVLVLYSSCVSRRSDFQDKKSYVLMYVFVLDQICTRYICERQNNEQNIK